jgi:acyl-CoA synthetase (AMP-forming)/AMP-acid ligase II
MGSVDELTTAELLEGLPIRIHEVYAPFVRDFPDHPAFVEGDRSWSYKQFSDAVDEAAKSLADLGVRSGDRLMIASENSVALGALLFAASKLDAWGVPVNPRLSAREIDLIGAHSAARRLLFNSALSSEAAYHGDRVGAKVGFIGRFGGIAVSPLNKDAQAEPVEKDAAHQVAGLLYTSGTTGTPKGVMLSHRNLMFAARTFGALRESGRDDRIYGVLPMSHIVGYAILLVATLMHGSTLHVVARADPAALARAIAEDGITSLFGVPATYQRLLEYKAVNGINRLKRGSLRVMCVAGAPLDLDLKERIEHEFGMPLLNNYGITECSPGLSGVRLDRPVLDESVGPFLPGIEHRIVDRNGKKVATDEVGELYVRGPNVMLGYYRAPDQTLAAIDRDGWFNTGDLARVNDEGHLYIAGRSKELIIRSGFNVYPAEVEAVLNAHDQIVQSAVVGRPVDGNEEIIAFVQLLPSANVSADDLKAYAAQQLTSYKRPTELIIVDALPTASTGKILKHRLREMALARTVAKTSTIVTPAS